MTLAVLVPYTRIPTDALLGLLQDFAIQAGTDYGEVELDLPARVEIIRRQMQSGEAVLIFFPSDESFQIVTAQEAKLMGLVS
ncbi:MAG: hypothetical protein RL497_1915 [Pseudomonadota bacterium]|jgi:uncharacterized protein YheU (UPF0270 family)